jgi:hypothetical protein
MPSRPSDTTRPPIVLQLGPHDFAVAVWIRDEGEQPVYEIRETGIREPKIAATVAKRLSLAPPPQSKRR